MNDMIYNNGTTIISPKLAVINGTTYAVPTINSIQVVKLLKGFGLFHSVLIIAGIFVGILSIGGFSTNKSGFGLMCLLFSALLLFIGILLRIPTLPARYSDRNPATHSDPFPATCSEVISARRMGRSQQVWREHLLMRHFLSRLWLGAVVPVFHRGDPRGAAECPPRS